MTEPLPDDIEAALRAGAERIGPIADRLTYHSVVSSTNDVALDLAAAGAEDWTTVLAGAQTAGRGRQGRRWFSAAGAGLYFSTVMRGIESSSVTLMAGVAVAEGVRDATGLPAEIKWPNDVVLPRPRPDGPGPTAKLAGILSEASGFRGAADAVVVGIGVNVAETVYPPELTTRASSLAASLGAPVARATVLVDVFAALIRWRRVLSEGGESDVLARWLELAPTSEGTTVEWNEQGRSRRGVTQGIDRDGALLVRCDGRLERVVAGEVTWPARPAQNARIRGERQD